MDWDNITNGAAGNYVGGLAVVITVALVALAWRWWRGWRDRRHTAKTLVRLGADKKTARDMAAGRTSGTQQPARLAGADPEIVLLPASNRDAWAIHLGNTGDDTALQVDVWSLPHDAVPPYGDPHMGAAMLIAGDAPTVIGFVEDPLAQKFLVRWRDSLGEHSKVIPPPPDRRNPGVI